MKKKIFDQEFTEKIREITRRSITENKNNEYTNLIDQYNLLKAKDDAVKLFTNQNWTQLAEECAILIQSKPNDCDILFMFSTALAQLNQIENAMLVATKLVNTNKDKHEYKNLLNSLCDRIENTGKSKLDKENVALGEKSIKNSDFSISLVTACMNRENHLHKSLPHWIKLKSVKEIIIVDWSNKKSLDYLCKLDKRIKIIRVEFEETFVLTYAYNIGITHAKHPYVFKCDSDCIPSENIFEELPDENSFMAGYWKNGSMVGKSSVNGQCIFLKKQYDKVNGYSEYIRTYGRDDEDFYDRLEISGLTRREISPMHMDFINHTHEDRTTNYLNPSTTSNNDHILKILKSTDYTEMFNYYIGKSLVWGPKNQSNCYKVKDSKVENYIILERDKNTEAKIPDEIKSKANLFSLKSILKAKSKNGKINIDDLNDEEIFPILKKYYT